MEELSLASQMQARRTELMARELEHVALQLFEARGFAEVTLDDVAAEAQISVRTFYRYFTTKDDVLHARIARRSAALRAALAGRPVDEPPLHSLRVAIQRVVADEDADELRRWTTVVATDTGLVRSVLGGIVVNVQPVIAEFLATRLGVTSDALGPTILAAAVIGVMQATQTHWYFHGGDLATLMSESFAVLERGIGGDADAWSRPSQPSRPRPTRARARR
jgi:AcrR family transcriptional regulator